MGNVKSIFASRTFWFGIAQIAYGAFGIFSGNLDQVQAWTLVTTGLASIGLRFKTTQPVSVMPIN